MVRTLLVLMTAALFSAGFVHAQSSARNDLTSVSYPVAELVIPIASKPDGKNATNEKELMAVICKNVAPATWEQAGGEGTMRYEAKGYVLHVRQTAKVHAELKAFLDQLQREQVSVEMRVVLVSESAVEQLSPRVKWTKKDGIESATMYDVDVHRFLESVQGDRRAHVTQAPKYTLFEGQEATLGALPGLQGRFLPTISADRRSVTLHAAIEYKGKREEAAKTQPEEPAFGDFRLAVVAKVPNQGTVALMAGTVTVEVRTESSPPLLSRVPYVTRLVRNVGYSRETMRMIVLLTPRIIRDEEVAEVSPLRGDIQAVDDGRFPLILLEGGKR